MIVFAQSNTNSHHPKSRVSVTRTVRPLPLEALNGFAQWIQHEPWTFVYDGTSASDMVARFDFLVNLNLNHHCPVRTFRTSNLDGKICSPAVRQGCRNKKREYLLHGNTTRYKQLKKAVKIKLKEASVNFLEKQSKLVSARNNSCLKHVKRIAASPGDDTTTTFNLPKHIEDNLSAFESSNRICKFFSAISQEYLPLNVKTLPVRVQGKLAVNPCCHPSLPDHIVYEGLRKGKKTCSVPGVIPIKILDNFLPELTTPIAAIYREAINTHTWPQSYKMEYHLPIIKVPNPESEDDLRNLGLTPFFSKRLEWFLIEWIWPFISPHLDLDQLGGIPGCFVNHYLIQMLDFIHRKLDNCSKQPTAIMCALVYFSKAFN